MSFNQNHKSPSIDVSKTFGFEITAFPPVKPKYKSLERCLNGAGLIFFEDGQGGYHLERKTLPIEATVNLSPNLYDEKTKACKSPEITFTYSDLGIKYYSRKAVVDFGRDISSRINWKQKIVWFTDEGTIVEWINNDEKNKE